MEAIAKYNFKGTAEDELAFTRGSILKILNMEDDPNWYLAELDGKEGIIPSNYVEMKPHLWYFGPLTRADTSTLLGNKSEGNFVVRTSESSPGNFSISVATARTGSIQHFKVLRDQSQYFLYDTNKFTSLNTLVDFYRTNTISKSGSDMKLKDMNPEDVFVTALFDFEPQEPGELAFRRDDIITVINKVIDENWWQGILGNRRGEFPSNYVGPFVPSS